MRIKKILVSQPAPKTENSPYFSLSEKQNVKIDFRPFIYVEGIPSIEIRKQRLDITRYTSVIFTSKNAVDHYFRVAEEIRFQVPSTMKCFCQSEAIAYYLQKYIVYRKRKIYIGKRDFEDLTEYVLKYENDQFLLPSSNILNDKISKHLDFLNINWKRAILYKTVYSDLSDLENVYYDILVFFSPSGIQSLFKNFPNFKQNNTNIAAYGSSTVKAAQDAGLKIQVEAPTPETSSMTMALDKFIDMYNKKSH